MGPPYVVYWQVHDPVPESLISDPMLRIHQSRQQFDGQPFATVKASVEFSTYLVEFPASGKQVRLFHSSSQACDTATLSNTLHKEIPPLSVWWNVLDPVPSCLAQSSLFTIVTDDQLPGPQVFASISGTPSEDDGVLHVVIEYPTKVVKRFPRLGDGGIPAIEILEFLKAHNLAFDYPVLCELPAASLPCDLVGYYLVSSQAPEAYRPFATVQYSEDRGMVVVEIRTTGEKILIAFQHFRKALQHVLDQYRFGRTTVYWNLLFPPPVSDEFLFRQYTLRAAAPGEFCSVVSTLPSNASSLLSLGIRITNCVSGTQCDLHVNKTEYNSPVLALLRMCRDQTWQTYRAETVSSSSVAIKQESPALGSAQAPEPHSSMELASGGSSVAIDPAVDAARTQWIEQFGISRDSVLMQAIKNWLDQAVGDQAWTMVIELMQLFPGVSVLPPWR